MSRLLLLATMLLAALAGYAWWADDSGEPGLTIQPDEYVPNSPLVEGTNSLAELRAINQSSRIVRVLSISTC